jgi:hypothetical protein
MLLEVEFAVTASQVKVRPPSLVTPRQISYRSFAANGTFWMSPREKGEAALVET